MTGDDQPCLGGGGRSWERGFGAKSKMRNNAKQHGKKDVLIERQG